MTALAAIDWLGFLMNGHPMELHQVRYFLALCQEQSFTRAARRCDVSQPSLSNAIKRLEAELGGPLFHRSRSNCVLTNLGQEVWPHLAELDRCARDAHARAHHFLTAPKTSAAPAVRPPSFREPIDRNRLEFNLEPQNDSR